MKRLSLLISCLLAVFALSAQVDGNHMKLHSQVNDAFYAAFEYPEIKNPEELGAKVAKTMDKLLNYPSDEPLLYEGRIVIRFSVYGLGRISHVHVVKGLCPEIDKAARKAMMSLRNQLKFSKEYRDKVYIQSFYISKDGSVKTHLSKDEIVYANPDKAAVPQGGEQGLLQFLADELQYPKDAMQERLQGKIMVQFTVDEEGYIATGYLNASDAGSLDFEALRMVGNIPPMQPAIYKGEAVRCAWLLPIIFRLTRD